jgi:hypothetical protein
VVAAAGALAEAGAVAEARSRPRPGPADPADLAIARALAGWLLAALALDLVVTRFVVRLAMFVPKDEPWASVGAVFGRLGAGVDALVPIVGVILLGALLARSGRLGGRVDRAILVGIGVVAAGGFALVAFPATPTVVLALDALVVVLAGATGARMLRRRGDLPVVALAGLVLLAGAVALAATARITGAVWDGAAGLAVDAGGQLAFVGGAGLVGLAGVASLATPGSAPRRTVPLVGIGVLVALVILGAGMRAPLMWGSLAIWSVGLAGAVPGGLVAVAAGLAVAGLPALHRRAPLAAIGASVVLLAGYGLAASGLVLAGLIGLVVAGLPANRERIGRTE